MKSFLACALIIFLITIHVDQVFAEEFESYMQEWDTKRDLATQYLIDAEKALKEGDEISGCISQRKAGEYGIEATESLLKAMEMNGSTEGLQNIKSGLNKWRELRDFC